MKNFTFNSASSICVNSGGSKRLADYVGNFNSNKVLLITDPGIIKNGLAQNSIDSLTKSGIQIKIFSDVIADPPVSVIHDAVHAAIEFKADCIIGFGGGSSMDVAKLVALVAKTGCKLDDIYGVNVAKGSRLNLILIPTTSGTGSEVTPISIVTTGENEKKGVVSPLLLPDLALLDAELTLGLPSHITAATGIDAMVHAIEAYTGKIHKNPISDCLAKEALRLISNSIDKACSDGNNIAAREDMLLGACLAGMSFANSPVGAVHALAYPIGARFHVPHGLSNSLVLPYVAAFNMESVGSMYSEIFDIISPANSGDTKSKNENFILYLKNLGSRLGLPSTLREVGIKESDINSLAKDAMNQSRLLVNNPRDVDLSSAISIYKEAL